MRIVVTIILLLSVQPFVNAQKHRKYVRQGNKEFFNGNYEQSEIEYRRALDDDPMSDKATFNLGDALYKKGEFEESSEEFQKHSSIIQDKGDVALSHYNRGNALLKAGSIESSIDAFKSSLLLDPANHQAKYNLAYAQDQLEQQKNQEKQDQENKDDQEQDNQNSDSKGDQNEDENQENKSDNEDQKSEQAKDSENQQQNPSEPKMTREDAERLLQALANDEKEVQEKVKKEKAAAARVKSIKNW